MKPDSYKILSRCVEEGIDLGWGRAHKHTDKPSEESIKNYIEECIINEVCEYFKFNEYEVGENREV